MEDPLELSTLVDDPELMDLPELPDEVLLMVFGNLKKVQHLVLGVSKVCKRWNQLAKEPRAWSGIRLDLFDHGATGVGDWLTLKVPTEVLRRAPQLNALLLGGSVFARSSLAERRSFRKALRDGPTAKVPIISVGPDLRVHSLGVELLQFLWRIRESVQVLHLDAARLVSENVWLRVQLPGDTMEVPVGGGQPRLRKRNLLEVIAAMENLRNFSYRCRTMLDCYTPSTKPGPGSCPNLTSVIIQYPRNELRITGSRDTDPVAVEVVRGRGLSGKLTRLSILTVFALPPVLGAVLRQCCQSVRCLDVDIFSIDVVEDMPNVEELRVIYPQALRNTIFPKQRVWEKDEFDSMVSYIDDTPPLYNRRLRLFAIGTAHPVHPAGLKFRTSMELTRPDPEGGLFMSRLHKGQSIGQGRPVTLHTQGIPEPQDPWED